MELTTVTTRFVLHWGEMGSRWGVNRTVAQIHALLFLADQPLHAEEIAETLAIARSNVSTSLKELQNWGLARIAFDAPTFPTGWTVTMGNCGYEADWSLRADLE